jgi:hypothetical protein
VQGVVARATGAVATFQVAGGTPSEDLRLPLLGALLAGTAGALQALMEGELDLVGQSMLVPSGAGVPGRVRNPLPTIVEGPAGGSGPPLMQILDGPPVYCLASAWEPGELCLMQL